LATAYVLINCELGSEEAVITELKSIEGVVEVHGTFGAYDILAKVESGQVEALRETITWKIRKIPYLGRMILAKIMKGADRVYADGLQLCHDVTELTGVPCEFLATSRKLPQPQKKILLSDKMELKHFLFVGRYHLNKGPDLLIKAVACLPDEIRESIRVHMFGLGPMENELKKKISEMQLERYINFNGPIQAQELSNYLDSVSFLVIPSRIESIPLVFSDALQRGTPVVAMPVGDLESLIQEYKCGVVARETSAEALADAIKKAVYLDKETFGKNIANAYTQFEIKGAAIKWQSLIPKPAEITKVSN